MLIPFCFMCRKIALEAVRFVTLRGCVSMVNGVKRPSVIRFEDVVSFYFFFGFTCIFRISYVMSFYFKSSFVFKDNGIPYLFWYLLCK